MEKRVRDFFLAAFGLWLLPGLALIGTFLLRLRPESLGARDVLRIGALALLLDLLSVAAVVLPRVAVSRIVTASWKAACDRRFLLPDFFYLLLAIGSVRVVEGSSWPTILLIFLYAGGSYLLVTGALGGISRWRQAAWLLSTLAFNVLSIGALLVAMAVAVRLGGSA